MASFLTFTQPAIRFRYDGELVCHTESCFLSHHNLHVSILRMLSRIADILRTGSITTFSSGTHDCSRCSPTNLPECYCPTERHQQYSRFSGLSDSTSDHDKIRDYYRVPFRTSVKVLLKEPACQSSPSSRPSFAHRDTVLALL